MLRGGAIWAIFVVAICHSAAAEDFRAATPTLLAFAATDAYYATTPMLRMTALPVGFSATTPTLTARTSGPGYRATTPPLKAFAGIAAFRATTPTLSANTSPATFAASTPALKAIVLGDGFQATTPKLRAVALLEPEDGSGPKQDDPATPPVPGALSRCDALLQCFSEQDILRVEADLLALGYTPETYPYFCQDVAQSLGECAAAERAPRGSALSGHATPPKPPEDDISGLNFDRCLALENYAIELQKRSDEGEDTDAEEERLALIIMSAGQHVMNGRADLFCAEITANLP